MTQPVTIPEKSMEDVAYRISADELRQFVERAESLDAEKSDIANQRKEVMADAKARGYCPKAINKLIAERKRDRDDLAEEKAIEDVYREALGM